MAAETGEEKRNFALMLPVEVKFVESYVTWMEDLSKHVDVSAMSKTDSLASYIKLILEDEKNYQLSENGKITCGEVAANEGCVENEEDDSDWNDSIGFAAMKLNLSAMYTYMEDYTTALAYLKYVESDHLDSLGLNESQREVIEYFRDSLSWSIGVLKGFEEEKNGGSLYFIKGSAKLNSKWESMEAGNGQVRATLKFLKASLAASMRVSEKASLDLLMESIKLDPQCHLWYHFAYRIARRMRRNLKRRNNARLPPPSAEEEQLGKIGYDLRPDDVVALTDFALLLKEKIWMNGPYVWKEREEDYLKCVELFEKALRLAKETDNKKWSRKIAIYLAEFLAFGKGDKLDQGRGVQLFEQCAVEYPTSTFVLHKVGKLYHHGLCRTADQDAKCVDLKLAKEYYKRAVEINIGNFPCLMDYLKLLQRLKDYSEMVHLIEKALELSKRDHQMAKLKIILGYITWIYNPRQLPDPRSTAIAAWMFIIEELPEFSRQVYDEIKDPGYYDREIPAHKIKTEIMEHLERMKEGCDDDTKLELLNTFIIELSKLSFRERRQRDARRGNSNPRYQRGGTHEGQGGELADKMKGLSVSSRNNCQQPANENGNWRKREETSKGDSTANENSGFVKPPPTRKSADGDNAWRKK